MSPETSEKMQRTDPITLDDLRHKALAIRDEVRDETERVIHKRGTVIVIGALSIVALSIGVAYFLGNRAARAAAAGPE